MVLPLTCLYAWKSTPQPPEKVASGASGVGGMSTRGSGSSTSSMDVTSSHADGTLYFLWASERTGFMHLYLYRYLPGQERAHEIRQITSGEWIVESVVGVDQVGKFGKRDLRCTLD